MSVLIQLIRRWIDHAQPLCQWTVHCAGTVLYEEPDQL
jgi:hypothetical protein